MSQDVLIVIVAAVAANVLLLSGLGLFLAYSRRPRKSPRQVRSSPLAPHPLTAGAAPTPGPVASRRGPFRVVRDLIDASLGMYLFRRLLGRPTAPRTGEPQSYLDEDVVASRIGAAAPLGPVVRRPTRIVVAGSPVVPVVASAPPKGPDRGRFYRDTVLAISGVAVALLLVVVVLPGLLANDRGEVLSATGTPDSSVGLVIAATPSPTPSRAPVDRADPVGDARPYTLARADRHPRPDGQADAATDRTADRQAGGGRHASADTETHAQADAETHAQADTEAHRQAHTDAGATGRRLHLDEERTDGLIQRIGFPT